jgi:DnaJ domain
MRGDATAYAALGLEPDADSGAIDRAYKKLIKLHHPDRQGGDAGKAAEINRAYRELRGRGQPSDLDFWDEEPTEPTGRGWVRAAMLLIFGVGALLLATGPVAGLVRELTARAAAPLPAGRVAPGATPSDTMDQPIDGAVVDTAIREAVRMSRSRDDAALANASRECNRALRARPTVAQLDRCAAFDDAVVDLQNHDPSWDGGPFSQLAVTRRQWSAASALSNDYLAVDGRLDRIRLQVELALAPADPPVPQVPVAERDENAASAD